ncbi:MAG: sensor histidine kinase [Planctomycetota bacterium]|jgi:two-component system sensor histidine kinase QseC
MVRSLQSRLLIGMTCGIALLLIVFGVGVYGVIRKQLVAEFDASLVRSARALAASVEQDEDGIEIEIDVRQLSDFKRAERPAYFQFRLKGGGNLKRSPSLARGDLPELSGTAGQAEITPVVLPDGRPGRAVGITFVPLGDGPENPSPHANNGGRAEVNLVVARDTLELAARLRFLGWVLGGGGAAVMTLALLVAGLVVRRGLRPLGHLAAQIAAMKEDRLQRRIGVDRLPKEMIPVGEKLNDLLARLAAAFERERAFTANVAHELRNPLAGVRATLEVAMSRQRQPEEYREALADCREITERLQSMVDSLLCLVRLDAGQVTVRREEINVHALVMDRWQELAGGASARNVVFDNRLPVNFSCVSGRPILAMVVQNLMDNAAQYVNEGGRICVTGTDACGPVKLTVSNTTSRLSHEDVPSVFEPFWRADSSRRDTGIHCGLGLTLVQRCMDALGGTVSADLDESRVFSVTVTLPRI